MASETATVLLQLFAIFAAAKILGGLGQRFGIPSVVGEILAGVVLGNTFLRGALQIDDGMHLLEVIAELGVIFLLFTVGLETPFEDMRRVGGTSILVAVLGVALPFAAGYAIMAALGAPTLQGLFLGAALVATSVGITARVLAEMGVIGRTEARIILGAAVIDDVLGLIVLTIVQAIGEGGSVTPVSVTILIVQSLAFVAVLMYFGGRALSRLVKPGSALSDRFEWASAKGGMFGFAVAACLGLSVLAAFVGLAAIIGAFLAGMAFAATHARHDLVERFEGVVQFLVPFFFGYIGLQIDIGVALSVAGLALFVTAVALLTKVVACGVGALKLGKKSALAIGIGMMPRGEVGIIVALIGLSLAAVPESLYAVVVAMSLLTTVVTPPLLVWAFRRLPGVPAQSSSGDS